MADDWRKVVAGLDWSPVLAAIEGAGPAIEKLGPDLSQVGSAISKVGPDLSRLAGIIENVGPDLSQIGSAISNVGPDYPSVMAPVIEKVGPDLSRLAGIIENVGPDLSQIGSVLSQEQAAQMMAAVTTWDADHLTTAAKVLGAVDEEYLRALGEMAASWDASAFAAAANVTAAIDESYLWMLGEMAASWDRSEAAGSRLAGSTEASGSLAGLRDVTPQDVRELLRAKSTPSDSGSLALVALGHVVLWAGWLVLTAVVVTAAYLTGGWIPAAELGLGSATTMPRVPDRLKGGGC
ncbi:MAG TPA: hypothetical protein VGJ86_06165 [Acidimicrobiales bacterium]|jgi:hypothetical protein